jgi:hypothetical protein
MYVPLQTPTPTETHSPCHLPRSLTGGGGLQVGKQEVE